MSWYISPSILYFISIEQFDQSHAYLWEKQFCFHVDVENMGQLLTILQIFRISHGFH